MVTTRSLDVFPESELGDETFSREEQAEALLKAFFSIADEWGLALNEARALLGNPGRSRFYDLRNGLKRAIHGLSDDEMDRLVYITGIYYGLGILFSPENTLHWLRNEVTPVDRFARPWGEGAPLIHMLTGKLEALVDIYRYVNGMRGG